MVILVECGSTQCHEFEIKAYKMEKSYANSHRQCPSPQVASQSEHHRRTTEVEQGAEQSLRAPVQSWPQLYTGSSSVIVNWSVIVRYSIFGIYTIPNG